MTSNTAPYGTVFGDSRQSNHEYYLVFDRDDSTEWASTIGGVAGQQYVGYAFTTPACVNRVEILPGYASLGAYVKGFKVQASNDNFATIEFESQEFTVPNSQTKSTFNFDNTQSYLQWRVIKTTESYRGDGYFQICTLDFKKI